MHARGSTMVDISNRLSILLMIESRIISTLKVGYVIFEQLKSYSLLNS